MFEKCDWMKYLINVLKHNYQSNNTCAEICFDFFFSSFNYIIYILIVTRLFNSCCGMKITFFAYVLGLNNVEFKQPLLKS